MNSRPGGSSSRRALLAVAALEFLHHTGGIHQLLLAGEEGVALGADLQANGSFLGGASLESLSTSITFNVKSFIYYPFVD